MKKLLMCSAAIALGLAVAAPAKADGIKLDLAGHFKGYVTWLSQDTNDEPLAKASIRHFDILRETEIHFTGETTLDNGLTVGVHHQALIDSPTTDGLGGTGVDLFATRKSYAYFSGAWGRVNFGKEDGANYLLEVAAPSADENFDGLRQYVNPFNIEVTNIRNLNVANNGAGAGGVGLGLGRGYFNTGKLDYANDATGFNNKLTYLTPVWNGFQAGGSYTPSTSNGGLAVGGIPGANDTSKAFALPTNNNDDTFGSAGKALPVTKASGRSSASRSAAATPMSAFRRIRIWGALITCPASTSGTSALPSLAAVRPRRRLYAGQRRYRQQRQEPYLGRRHRLHDRSVQAGRFLPEQPRRNGSDCRPRRSGQPGHDALGGWCGIHLRPRHDLPRLGGMGSHDSSGHPA